MHPPTPGLRRDLATGSFPIGGARVFGKLLCMAEQFFRITNTVALLGWIALLALPGNRKVSGLLCVVLLPGALAAAYAVVIVWKLFTGGPSPDELGSIAGLRIAFADDWVLAAAWTHYLVFDMVVGAWIARDAVRLRIPWPVRSLCLVLTFLLGPIGFLLHLVARAMKAQQVAVDD
jgi:Domain of unknown function (DUF4281)